MPELGGKNFTLRDDVGWPFNDIPEPEVYRRDDCVYADCEEAHLVLGNLSFCNRAAPDKKKIYDRRKCGISFEKEALGGLALSQCNESYVNPEPEFESNSALMSFLTTGSPLPNPKYIHANAEKYWNHHIWQSLEAPYMTFRVNHWRNIERNGYLDHYSQTLSDCYSYLEMETTAKNRYGENFKLPSGKGEVALEVNGKDMYGRWPGTRAHNPNDWQTLYQANGLGDFDPKASRLWVGTNWFMRSPAVMDFVHVSWIDNPVIGETNTMYSLNCNHMMSSDLNFASVRSLIIDYQHVVYPFSEFTNFEVKFVRDPAIFQLNSADVYQRSSPMLSSTPAFVSEQIFLPAFPPPPGDVDTKHFFYEFMVS